MYLSDRNVSPAIITWGTFSKSTCFSRYSFKFIHTFAYFTIYSVYSNFIFQRCSCFSNSPTYKLVGTHTLFISNFSLCAAVSAPRWQSVVYAWVLFIFPPRPNRDDSLVLMSSSLMQSRIKWIPLGAGVVQAHSEWLGCRFVSLGSNKFSISSYLLRSHVELGGGKKEKIEEALFSYC